MTMVGLAAIFLSAAYFAAALIVRRGMRRRACPVAKDEHLPFISVVVAARNEEAHISACMESLRGQRYPADRWELVVVDDRSEDATAAHVEAWRGKFPALRLVRVDARPSHLTGKQHALSVGIAASSGEIIAMTDADCTVPPEWLHQIAAACAPDVGIVAGLTTFVSPSSWWAQLQRADLAHLMGTAWGFIGLGAPISAIGNNLALRREAHDEVGGYGALGYTFAEDCAMVQRIARTRRWRAVMLPPSAAVRTYPMPTLHAFLRQRARWASGVHHLRGWRWAFLLGVFLQRVATLAATGLACGGMLRWYWPVLAWGLWMCADAFLIVSCARAMGIPTLARWSPLVSLWQACYQPVVGLWGLCMPARIRWKG